MIEILIKLIVVIPIFINILIIIMYFYNKLVLAGHYCIIKFSQFKKFYALCPNEYRFESTYVDRYGTYIVFNLLDTYRYILFLILGIIRAIKKEHNKNKKEHDKNKKIYLELVKSDIEELNKKAEEEIEKATKEINKINKLR